MKLEWRRQTIRTKHFFATSQGGTSEKETIVVSLEHDGVTGLGEIVPSGLYGQSLEKSEAALARLRSEISARPGDFDPYQIETWVDHLIANYDDQRAFMAAIDSCLHDWVGKKLGVPVWKLLGLKPAQTQTTFTIGISSPDETRNKLAEAMTAGYSALKVKVGVPGEAETLRIIREKFDGPLLLDANEGWTADEAVGRIQALAKFKPTMIEQPLARRDWQKMGELRRLGVAPIFADEDCQRPADVVRLHGHVDGVNIKLTKCGGIRQGMRMIALARELGMKAMLGCFVSSSLQIAPALAFSTLVDFADLDGALLLASDPFVGIESKGSKLWVGDGAGLGVKPA